MTRWPLSFALLVDRPLRRGLTDVAGVGAGVYHDLDDAVATSVRVLRTHSPDPRQTARLDAGYARYRRTVDALAGIDLAGDT